MDGAIAQRCRWQGQAAALMFKQGAADTPVKAMALSGRLYVSEGGWLMLSVPNALVRGAFDALDEVGAELPLHNGKLNAHISVASPDEVEAIGGPGRISERGHAFLYNLGPLKAVKPDGWEEMSKVWFFTVESPDLRKLRQSYGLEPLRKGYEFHITVATRRKGVLYPNDVKKVPDLPPQFQQAPNESETRKVAEALRKASADLAVDFDATLAEKLRKFDPSEAGDPREGAREAMQALKEDGHRLLIFTCRGDTKPVAEWLKKHDIPYDEINENSEQPKGTSGKIMADLYIDDKAVDATPPWPMILKEIRRRLGKDETPTKAARLLLEAL
jgi:hypothetical protein